MKRVLTALILLSSVVAACGIDTDSSAVIADEDQVPFGLLDEDRQPVTGPEPNGEVFVNVYLYVEEDDVLAEVVRPLESASLDAVLGELERSPTDAESADDLRSALAEIDAVGDSETSGGVATIDLTDEFSEISGSDQLVALAQLVYTATARPGIGQVRFTLEGEAIEIPRGDGSLTSESVTRGDYRRLAPSRR